MGSDYSYSVIAMNKEWFAHKCFETIILTIPVLSCNFTSLTLDTFDIIATVAVWLSVVYMYNVRMTKIA